MSLRDEMADAIKKIKVFRPSPEDMADALMPLVERAVRLSAEIAMAHGAAYRAQSSGKVESIVASILK